MAAVERFKQESIGPFIRGKIRRELYHLYEHVLSKTRTARINGPNVCLVRQESGSCREVAVSKGSTVIKKKK